MHTLELFISQFTIGWIAASSCVMFFVLPNNSNIIKFGPNPDFFILNVCIDTPVKYISIVTFCFLNSGVRSLNHTILQSWITNTIQNKQYNQTLIPSHSYQISFATSIYSWFDFFMYMNILMAQFDMLVIEIISDLLITFIVTRYYLKEKRPIIKNNEMSPLINRI